MDESRVDRLLRLAEEHAIAGNDDTTTALLDVADRAIYVHRLEVQALNKQYKLEATNV